MTKEESKMNFPSKEQIFQHDGYRLIAIADRYCENNSFAAELWTYGYEFDEPYIQVTVNLPEVVSEQEFIDPNFFNSMKGSYPVAFVDINGGKWLPDFLVENEIAFPVSNGKGIVTADSGFVKGYPLYAFRLDKFFLINDVLEGEEDES